MIFSITEILSDLVRIGVNLTDNQVELLKWRLSPEARLYYNEKENRNFYEALMNGNTDIVDAIRKEKQQRINDLKNGLATIILLLIIPFFSSCSMFSSIKEPDLNIIEQKWDVNSLTTKDRTYVLEDQTIKVKGFKESLKFSGHWFVVNEDFIKTFNENQDTLIKALTIQKKQKIYTVIIGTLGSLLFIFIIINVIIFKLKRR